MTKSKFNHKTKLKILALVPLTAILIVGVACVNGKNKQNIVTAVELVRMNVLYVGVDNPIRIAASGYEASQLIAVIDNGVISGKDGEYIVRPDKPGTTIITVSSKDKVIQTTTFRAKIVPDPVAKIGGSKGGVLDKKFLLEQEKVIVEMENFDFDLKFEIVEFVISTVFNGYWKELKSSSDIITEDQKALLRKIQPGGNVYFNEIKCKGSDGSVRKLGTVAFKLK